MKWQEFSLDRTTVSLESLLQRHQEALNDSFTEEKKQLIEDIVQLLIVTFKEGRKLLLCGNGGSAADSQHIAAEFIARYKIERKSLPAIALTTDTSILTATANDYNFDRIFSRQVEGLGNRGDVLIGISTSGNSSNVLNAFEEAKKKQMKTVGFTGANGGKMKSLADYCYCAGSNNTPSVQEMHILVLHAICELLEIRMFTDES